MPTDEQRKAATEMLRRIHYEWTALEAIEGVATLLAEREAAARGEGVHDVAAFVAKWEPHATLTGLIPDLCAQMEADLRALIASREAAARADERARCRNVVTGYAAQLRKYVAENRAMIAEHPDQYREVPGEFAPCEHAADVADEIAERILAATPPDRVVVAREDAEMAATALDLTAARWAHDEADPMPGAAQMADAAATRIRAALARLEASDG